MSNKKKNYKQERHIRIRSVRKDPPDLRKLAGAIIALAQAQAEAEAEAEAKQRTEPSNKDPEGEAENGDSS